MAVINASPNYAGACWTRVRRVNAMQKQHISGFTLVELIVVIIILVILVAIIMPVFSSITRSNNQHTCANNLQNLGILLAQYRQDNGVYPAAPLPAYLRTINPVSLPFSDANAQVSATSFTMIGNAALPNETPGECQANLSPPNIYHGISPAQFLVQIDSTPGSADTFCWSTNGGTTWIASGVAITTTPQWLSGGLQVTFNHATGHQVGDAWTFTVTPVAGVLPQRQALQPIRLTQAANAGDTQVNVVSTTGLATGMNVLLHNYDPDSDISDAVTITNISSNGHTVTFTPPIQQDHSYPIDPAYNGNPGNTDYPDYANFGVLDPRVGNFGLTTLYYQDPYISHAQDAYSRNFQDQGTITPANPKINTGPKQNTMNIDNGSIERTFSTSSFHCPQITTTEAINLDANLKAGLLSNALATFRKVDPLWAGVNTYNTTYNYDQYDKDIHDFDTALGYSTAGTNVTPNSVRQLKNPAAPADTVVCWCYGHRSLQQPSYTPITQGAYDFQSDSSQSNAVQNATLRAFTAHRRSDRLLVLWVDGSVNAETPTLALSVSPLNPSPQLNYYYWIPPFLSSPGDWRQ